MHQEPQAAVGTVPDRAELDQYASYEDEGSLVICDKTEPAAWVRSDVTEPIRP